MQSVNTEKEEANELIAQDIEFVERVDSKFVIRCRIRQMCYKSFQLN